MSPETHFAAPWGRPLRWMSALGVLVLVGVSVLGAVAPKDEPDAVIAMLVTLLMPPLVLAITALFTIRGYVVTRDALRVRRLFWSNELPLRGLSGVEVDAEALKGSLRIAGNGGLFSFSGFFWNRKLGRFRAYVTDFDRAVVLRFDGRVVVVTPENPQAFAAALSGHVRKG
jgi:hypothetical protein